MRLGENRGGGRRLGGKNVAGRHVLSAWEIWEKRKIWARRDRGEAEEMS